jgi:hypothetical protein
VLFACLVAAAVAAKPETITGGHWLLTALASRLFLVCGAVLVASLAVLLVLSYALWKIGSSLRRRVQPQGGAAIVEFAMVLPILLLLVLLMGQSALLMTGNLCVHYAAFCAARSAIVQVPLALNDTEPRNVLADADTIRDDLVAIGHIEAVVDARLDGTVAVFGGDPGPRYRWRVEGMAAPPDLGPEIRGALFEEEAVDRGRERILVDLRKSGHLRAAVEASSVAEDGYRTLVFRALPGPVLQADVAFPGADQQQRP